MRVPPPDPSRANAADVPSRWDDSALLPGSGFGALADRRARSTRRTTTPSGAVFDLCHVGMVLRTVLLVEAVVVAGVTFVATGLADLAHRVALGSALALPAMIAWLALACLLQSRLARFSAPAQGVAAALLGAVCGGFGWALLRWAGEGLVDTGAWPGPVIAGALLAWLLTVWLQQRDRGRLPAHATARLAELQSRIRPHFLFNTLNSALGLVRRDPERAEALLEDLAELFRGALAVDASAVTLDDEIELARRYLAIEQIRFGSRLQVVWQLDPAAGGARVPPLLLQPLVENAVRHGIEPDPNGGVVRIRTRVRHGLAWLSIGNSLPEGPHGQVGRAGHGIALQNVRDRLRLMHDLAARFQTATDTGWYRVDLAVPLPAD
jgi:two-component system, LytTR family, sensor histidine kinase AlgZ